MSPLKRGLALSSFRLEGSVVNNGKAHASELTPTERAELEQRLAAKSPYSDLSDEEIDALILQCLGGEDEG